MQLDIYRPDDGVIASFKIGAENKATFTQSLMAEHKIVCSLTFNSRLKVNIGDYIIYDDVHYTLNDPANITKVSSHEYKHDITFEAPMYTMYNRIFRQDDDAEFTYVGELKEYLYLLVENMNAIDSGWVAGDVFDTESKQISFDNVTCLQALSTIVNSDNFNCEFYVSNKQINIVKKVGYDTTLEFAYGKGNGLFQLTRNNIEDKNLVTRLYPYGGSTNLPNSYVPSKLMLPEKYLEMNVDKYGVREGPVNFDEIFPHRDGTITAVSTDYLSITDSSLDFNLNDQTVKEDKAKVVFKSGALSGYEFEISSYDNTNKRMRLNKITDTSTNTTLPNENSFPEIGDIYTITGITMPQTYVDSAIEKLRTEAQDYIAENSIPRVAYGLTLSEIYAKQNNIHIGLGDRVNLTDSELNVDAQIRVTEISFPLYRPFKITATIADSVGYSYIEKVIAQTVDNKTQIKEVDRTQAENARQNLLLLRQLQSALFDPDNYFDGNKLKPDSVETLYLGVGADSMNFQLSGVSIAVNAGGNPNTIDISSGDLIHYSYSIAGLGNEWHLDNKTVENMTSDKLYYLYAKLSKTSLQGEWIVDTAQHKTDEETGYYWLLTGVIYAVDENNARNYDLINGITAITGDRIITGRIQDLSGQNYWNLSAGTWWMGNNTAHIDWSVTKEGQLTIKGVVMSDIVIADEGFFDNLYVKKLASSDSDDVPRLIAESGEINFYPANETDPSLQIGVDLDDIWGNTIAYINEDGTSKQTSGIKLGDNYGKDNSPTSQGVVRSTSKISVTGAGVGVQNGAFAYDSSVNITCGLYGSVNTGKNMPQAIAAGVIGIDNVGLNMPQGQSYGGYFNSLRVGSLVMETLFIQNDTTTKNPTQQMSDNCSKVVYYDTLTGNTEDTVATVRLPTNPKMYQIINGYSVGNSNRGKISFTAPSGYSIVSNTTATTSGSVAYAYLHNNKTWYISYQN